MQPQLVLLQKTLLNIEGLGLQLDPELDLWKTAKPWLEHWMSEQIGWRGFFKALHTEAPHYATLLPQLPRLLHQHLNENPTAQIEILLRELVVQQQRRNQWLMLTAISVLATCTMLILPLVWLW